MLDYKPAYLIYYKDKEWMTRFIQKHLALYHKELEDHTYTENKTYIYYFKYFDVVFEQTLELNKDTSKDYKVWGIIIQRGIKCEDDILKKGFVKTIINPFIGAIHILD